jgi:chromosome partitioning protein
MAGHIAVQAEIAGAGPVAIVDTDPQGSLADWWNERQAEYPAFAHTFVSRIGEDVNRLKELGIKTCVVPRARPSNWSSVLARSWYS